MLNNNKKLGPKSLLKKEFIKKIYRMRKKKKRLRSNLQTFTKE